MTHSELHAFMQTRPDGTLEAIAEKFNTTLLEVIQHLPEHTLVSGDKFDAVWDSVVEWGSVTTLTHRRCYFGVHRRITYRFPPPWLL